MDYYLITCLKTTVAKPTTIEPKAALLKAIKTLNSTTLFNLINDCVTTREPLLHSTSLPLVCIPHYQRNHICRLLLNYHFYVYVC